MIRLVVLLLALAAAVPARAAEAPADTTVGTVILVRHAEKNEHPPGGDAGLNTKGLLRARELARVLADSGVRRVYASPFGRAQLTAKPLAEAIGDSVHTYDPEKLEALAARVRLEAKGGTIVIVGHGDTVPQTIEALTGTPFGAPEATPYDRMWVVTLGPGRTVRVVRLRYGAPAD